MVIVFRCFRSPAALYLAYNAVAFLGLLLTSYCPSCPLDVAHLYVSDFRSPLASLILDRLHREVHLSWLPPTP